MADDKDQTDVDFDKFWKEKGETLCKKISYAFFIAGTKSGVDQCQKIIRGDDE